MKIKPTIKPNTLTSCARFFGISFVMSLTLFAVAVAQPPVPVLDAPADAAIDQPQELTLVWNASDGAVSYTLQVSEGNDDFSSTIFNESDLTDTTQLISGLSLETTYHWRVSATNGGTSDFSGAWTFTTWASPPVSPAPVDLGTAGDFVILAETAITTTGTTAITGDVGISPAATSYITGFDLIFEEGIASESVFATSALVTGKVYGADMKVPTPANLTTAVGNMGTAYNDAAGRPDPDFTELHVGALGGKTLVPGLYKWGTDVTAATNFTISGGEDDVWIFQIAQDLTLASDINVTLSGGAQAQNIFWQVSGEVAIGTNSHFEGIILSKTAIHLLTGASMNGRLLAQTAVTLNANAVIEPSGDQDTSIDGSENQLSTRMTLSQNYPNPFNPTTTIGFELPETAEIRLSVFNLLGQEIAVLVNEVRSAGSHQISWDAQSVSSGLYLYRLSANGQVLTGKMSLMK